MCENTWGADVVCGHRWLSHSSEERDHRIFESFDRMKEADKEYDQQLDMLKKEALTGRQTLDTVQL